MGLQGRALRLQSEGAAGRFAAMLPAGAAGQWCRLAVSLAPPDPAERWWVKLEATDTARGHVVREAFLGRARLRRGRVWRTTLVHLPSSADRLTLQVFGAAPDRLGEPCARLLVQGRRRAAMALLADGWRVLPGAVAGDARGLAGRVRTLLGQHPARSGQAPPYDLWRTLYDDWRPLRDALMRRSADIGIDIVLVGSGPPAEATLASLRAQWLAPACVDAVARPADWRPDRRPDRQTGAADWVLVIGAGEVLAPHGLACFAEAVRRAPDATGFYADLDDADAVPLLKPRQPDPWLLGSGLLTRGACLFRAGALSAGGRDAAEWRRSAAGAPDAVLRSVPCILTRLPQGGGVEAARTPAPGGTATPFVSIIVPTSGREGHMVRCLRALLARTAYADFEILLAVSRIEPGDRRQAAHLADAARLPRVRVLDLKMDAFNYAAVNNASVAHARGEFVLLLNDDVVPDERDWLRRLVAFVCGGPIEADIAGARLLYGNGLVQHGGVTMGLANLCEHCFRLSDRHAPGPHGLALLNRQVSAATAACLLLRRSLYETLGGMDEAFAVALNDVDFCLRAGQAGARIVIAAEVTLFHYESLSLGRHYEGSRADLEALEVRRLRERWACVIADDPFYSPLASLEPGREFQPGFPPRITPSSWLLGGVSDPA